MLLWPVRSGKRSSLKSRSNSLGKALPQVSRWLAGGQGRDAHRTPAFPFCTSFSSLPLLCIQRKRICQICPSGTPFTTASVLVTGSLIAFTFRMGLGGLISPRGQPGLSGVGSPATPLLWRRHFSHPETRFGPLFSSIYLLLGRSSPDFHVGPGPGKKTALPGCESLTRKERH